MKNKYNKHHDNVDDDFKKCSDYTEDKSKEDYWFLIVMSFVTMVGGDYFESWSRTWKMELLRFLFIFLMLYTVKINTQTIKKDTRRKK